MISAISLTTRVLLLRLAHRLDEALLNFRVDAQQPLLGLRRALLIVTRVRFELLHPIFKITYFFGELLGARMRAVLVTTRSIRCLLQQSDNSLAGTLDCVRPARARITSARIDVEYVVHCVYPDTPPRRISRLVTPILLLRKQTVKSDTAN
ncbi:hypothetical protein GJW-30_1_02436 [Variibacter gotjawalensis]|uniref:Uncharacterized protein n=1 Tax=Variibacter gotjawalensis TaxID=1333996 RepID=A0A0S3PVG0_9BRAD|nr:hypothetical protein GJW-30_1_02436 [Variibacter gotjawalensis]